LNQEPPENKSEALSLHPTCLYRNIAATNTDEDDDDDDLKPLMNELSFSPIAVLSPSLSLSLSLMLPLWSIGHP
jgi:hypothetical protein